jgi:hypothetical protein
MHFKDPVTGVHTNTIEGRWNGLKRQNPIKCRNQRFANIYILRFMLIRNKNTGCFYTIINLLFKIYSFLPVFCNFNIE